MVGVAGFFAIMQLAIVVSDARLQEAISGPGRP